ncbi:phosphotransferase family protein [Nocardioides sp. Kera G14]|uniref:phosphotransferase family protein n=1 Tax=Nocardioides sp. Kera G14 TaxID=2884264 RepID=UPI001D1165B1|nr:phosphotransferase family protein [Nocardioides sp. Kera G14]UDY24963.1 phosphotransferase family protein [Nocardioides sp. Kera G14]
MADDKPGEVAGARPVRDEDAFDVVAVDAWLRAHADGEAWGTGVPDVRQFSGGASNLTYLLRYPARDLILRRPPAGTKAKGAHDMGREFRIQSALAPVFPYVAPMVGHCSDESVIGSEFYVMERVVGSIPRMDFTRPLTESQVRDVCTNTLDLLVALHAVDPAAAGLGSLGKGDGYVARQVSGWTERYRKAITPNVGDWAPVIAWLEANQPADVAECLIHNDFRFDNVVYDDADPTRPIALLDWELATVGDPLMDLGSSLAYWIEAGDDDAMQLLRMQPTTTPGMLTRAEVVAYYCERAGLSVTPEQWTFYEVFGLFRLAGIAQQIYYRFHHGQTTNKRFEPFWMMVNLLEERSRALIGAEPAGHF